MNRRACPLGARAARFAGVAKRHAGGFSDLSLNLGIHRQLDHPDFRAAVARVVAACRARGKAAGIVIAEAEALPRAWADGFTVISLGQDITILKNGFRAAARAFEVFRSAAT